MDDARGSFPILIFTDGACSGNPGPGGWGSIVALPEGRVYELGGGEARTTNNRMELLAAISALESVAEFPEAAIVCTDSTYMISGVTQWLAGWKRRGWLSSTGEPVLNRDLWERLDALAQARRGRLSWRYVRGHSGHGGNERCDEIAVGWSRGRPVPLFEGSRADYPVTLEAPAARDGAPPARKTAVRRGPAGSKGPAAYLSLLDGVLQRHSTWAECQARVHGRNAKFKKVSSPDEEAATLKAWGLA
jgi:ribonuclease HI